MELGINDILLHYENLGDFDYKVTVTVFLVTKYIQSTTGVTEAYAKKKALALRDPIAGWAVVLDDDERFYEWCKRRFYSKAVSKRSKTKFYAMFWLDERGRLKRYDFATKESAFCSYERKAAANMPVTLYIRQTNGALRSFPIKRHNAVELLSMVNSLLEEEQRNGTSTAAALCRKTRQVNKCEECVRFLTCQTIMEGEQND